MKELLLLVVGFVLTTVVGGYLGSYLQNRAWRNQHDVELRDADRATAIHTYTELSKLLDKRLYRMRQLSWALREGDDAEDIGTHLASYRDVLVEWNDALNRNLAMTEAYFGRVVRDLLENSVYEQFAAVGRRLDSAVRAHLRGETRTRLTAGTDKNLTVLSLSIYRVNVEMLRLIQQEAVGRSRIAGRAVPSEGTLRRGDVGLSVRRWQTELRKHGSELDADGAFGPATEKATRSFQTVRGLDADGIVGDGTRVAMVQALDGKKRRGRSRQPLAISRAADDDSRSQQESEEGANCRT